MKFSDNRTATFDCSFRKNLRQWAEVTSSKRSLYLDDFVVCQKLDVSHKITSGSIGERALYFPSDVHKEEETKGCNQNAQLVTNFANMVLSGKIETTWPELSLKTQR